MISQMIFMTYFSASGPKLILHMNKKCQSWSKGLNSKFVNFLLFGKAQLMVVLGLCWRAELFAD